jgi:hypothetical protein
MTATADTIPVELGRRERHALADLLERCIQPRIVEQIERANAPADLCEAGERARLLAQLQGLARGEGTLPREDIEAQRGYLAQWVSESDVTTDEQEAMLAELRSASGRSLDELERLKRLTCGADSLRITILIDHAHATVCESIICQLDAAREAVCA